MAEKKEQSVDETERGFDDSELEDIMSEIEDLENDVAPKKMEHDPIAEEMGDIVIEPVAETVEDPTSEMAVEDVQAMIADGPEATDEELEAVLDAGVSEEDPDTLEIAPEAVVEKTDLQKQIDDEFEGVAQVVAEEIAPAPEHHEEPEKDKIVSIDDRRDSSSPAEETQMDFTVTGQMNLKLNFRVGDQTVGLTINEGEGFTIQMEGGAKFTIPLSSHKKAG